MLEDAVAAGSENPLYFAELAIIASVSGDVARGVTWMQRAYDQGYRSARWADLDPMFDSLRGDPEFETIMTQIRADVDVMRQEVLAVEAELEAARLANAR